MKGLKRAAAWASAAIVLALAAGCGTGGAGSGAGSGGLGTRAALDVYVTDGFSDQFKQVLATLFKIELTTDGTNFTTVFEDDNGRTIDLASLSNTSELLASVTVPAGSYTGARITFGDHVTLVSNAGVSTSVAVASDVGAQANGQVAITVNTPARVLAHQTNSVTVDFKLAEFQLVGGTLRPSIACGAGLGPHPGGQRTAHIEGAVTAVNGTTSFTLQGDHGRTTTVNLTSTTTVTSGQTGAAATLAVGQNVIVEGTYDPSTATITATSVTLNDFTSIVHAEATGTVASVDSAAGTFVLTLMRAEGIRPTGGTITVATFPNTEFETGPRHNGTFSSVTVGASVAAEGTFDTTTQTLNAREVGVH
ncbi:MAG TPA: DUF4382 domain-containing protein [Chthonomonadaceae bacterium]|nr:DUF4382 domain-containing protein [Chthonomonadaceae bacterium]